MKTPRIIDLLNKKRKTIAQLLEEGSYKIVVEDRKTNERIYCRENIAMIYDIERDKIIDSYRMEGKWK